MRRVLLTQQRAGHVDEPPAGANEARGAAQDLLIGADGNGNGTGFGLGQHGLVANITASYELTPQFQIYVNGQNIFDSLYEPVSGFQIPGPTVLAGVRMRL